MQQRKLNEPGQLKRIPLISEERKRELFADTTSIYDIPKRAGRHYTAQFVIHALYHMGATMINNDADHVEDNLLIKPEIEDIELEDLQPIPSLMDQYNSLPQFETVNGRNLGKNPLQFSFILIVVLDYLEPEHIYKMYKSLLEDLREMTRSFSSIELPNGSKLLDDGAVVEFLRSYMLHNRERFAFLSSEELDNGDTRYLEKCPSILGRISQRNEEMYKQFEELMHRKISYRPDTKLEDITCFTQLTSTDGSEKEAPPFLSEHFTSAQTLFPPPDTKPKPSNPPKKGGTCTLS